MRSASLKYQFGERNLVHDQEKSNYRLGAPLDPNKTLAKHLLSRAAVYAMGPKDGPIKIGFSRKLVGRLTEIQVSSPLEVKFHSVCWVAGTKEAGGLEARCHNILRTSGRHIRGEWFNITCLEVKKVIDRASIDLGCVIVPHGDLLRVFPLSSDPLAGCFW